ncbi:dephospho-CoA kinase [Acerihabitans arboris]|uniref:Dephospho-CoA kinase n=1 Tax=Acerihabitans arboris TaxID=2691583 RepID=A0A845SDW4_9GAMM|nr:dephospho-CoA kinase [Acerihabitans arboris]NDL61276.1 dephospho-CoA kinase [Acerihabitans arboris]
MRYIVALTGGIGSGKSTVANAFAELGATIVDADVIARQVVEPGTDALRAIHARFGAGIMLPDGRLDRALLRQHVFSSPADKAWLNRLLHPLIQQETRQQMARADGRYVLWVVPLLIENQLQSQADRVLVVDVGTDVQIARTLSRDGISRSQINNILAAQASREQRLACADDIIDNSGRPEEITAEVANLHRRYLQLAASATRQD